MISRRLPSDFGLFAANSFAADEPVLSTGQTLVSTHISIRNTDPQVAIRLLSARYYDTNGKLYALH